MTRIRLQFVHAFHDRHGKLRHYFRRPGFKQTPLVGPPGSAEFMEAYQAALAGLTTPHQEVGVSRTRREDAHRLLGKMKPGGARNWLKTLRGLLVFAVAEGFRADDPTHGIKLQPLKSAGIPAWTEEEIAQFEAHYPIGTKARLAFALLLDTAQRTGDVVRMGRQHVQSGAIHIRQNKTGETLAIPIYPSLQAVLDATPCALHNMTFLMTARGKPFTAAGFGDWFRDRCNKAGLPKRCTAHGLRKAAARRLAEEGATTHQIASMTGHRSLSEVQRYTSAANQAKLAREAVESQNAKNKMRR